MGMFDDRYPPDPISPSTWMRREEEIRKAEAELRDEQKKERDQLKEARDHVVSSLMAAGSAHDILELAQALQIIQEMRGA